LACKHTHALRTRVVQQTPWVGIRVRR
jgi:hypothetical protein